ncbi:MAG: hypothetical protein H0U52_12825 [Chloroflexi bacterium]|nr:hypothetical protein [Chloroflexota bacterium]
MNPRRSLVLLTSVALLVAACTTGGGAMTSPFAPASSIPSAAATRIEVALTDSLKIEPAAMTVPRGTPVTFVVTNSGATDHEFYLGDEAAQAAHEKEMTEMGGMAHDGPGGIALKPGETKELTYTFAAVGESLAGCHVVGHYGGGMKATITVTGS